MAGYLTDQIYLLKSAVLLLPALSDALFAGCFPAYLTRSELSCCEIS